MDVIGSALITAGVWMAIGLVMWGNSQLNDDEAHLWRMIFLWPGAFVGWGWLYVRQYGPEWQDVLAGMPDEPRIMIGPVVDDIESIFPDEDDNQATEDTLP